MIDENSLHWLEEHPKKTRSCRTCRVDGLGAPPSPGKWPVSFLSPEFWCIKWTMTILAPSCSSTTSNWHVRQQGREILTAWGKTRQQKSFTTKFLYLPGILAFNMLQQRHAGAVPENVYHLGSSVEIRIFHIFLKSPRQQVVTALGSWGPHHALNQKLPEFCIYRICSGMAMAAMFISKQLSWFRHSKAFNEWSEWNAGKNMEQPWTILTRLSPVCSRIRNLDGFGSSQRCLPVCMIIDTVWLLSNHPDIIFAYICNILSNIISNKQGRGIPLFIHVQLLNPSSSCVLSTSMSQDVGWV